MPTMNISVIDGWWGLTFLTSKTVASVIEAALSRLTVLAAEAAPLTGRFEGGDGGGEYQISRPAETGNCSGYAGDNDSID